jgi:delta-aminolevulinic acid dehydratase/porphobilinogen synthase
MQYNDIVIRKSFGAIKRAGAAMIFTCFAVDVATQEI